MILELGLEGVRVRLGKSHAVGMAKGRENTMLCSELPETVLYAELVDSAQIGGGEMACSGMVSAKLAIPLSGK